jgi:Nucleotidyl transferase AbiEii toxin, Type IV TA system
MNMSIKPLPINVVELIESKFKINPAFTEKDWYTQHILGVIHRFESDEFEPVFSGGTSLSKGYRLIERFSEDIDFRVKPLQPGLTRSVRSSYQDRLVAEVLESSSDLSLAREVYKRDRSNFLKFQIAYPSQFSGINALRPFIQVEMSFDEPPLLEPSMRPLSSLVNQFTEFGGLARQTIEKDLKIRGQEVAEELKTVPKLLTALIEKLGQNPLYGKHYRDFVETVSYGESPSFEKAIENLGQVTKQLRT